MDESQRNKIGIFLASALLIGLFAGTLMATYGQSDDEEEFRDLMESMDGSLESARLGNSVSTSEVKNSYNNITPENFEGRPELEDLDNEIRTIFEKQSFMTDDIKNLKDKVSKMGSQLGLGLPLAVNYAVLVILGMSVSVTFLVNFACKQFIDWDLLEKAEESLERWSQNNHESSGSKGKKKQEILERNKEVARGQSKVWSINTKQAFFYLAPFFLLLAWLGYVFSDWTVAWLPFDWFTSGIYETIGVSFTFLGWLTLTYFGFAQIWRMALLSEVD